MARLNEPPVSADSFDALRRKFLRQNRDIARVNSTQSLRIRGLENECARLLSENLDLRGQVLRLEKEVESNTSQRIADHALQIKRKMETQLHELSTLLADFGLEPPTKRTSPPAPQRSVTKALARLNLGGGAGSPELQQKRHPPLAPLEAETLAVQEGRLPPIFENKTYPRQNLTKEELRALLSDDSTESDSPLAPPPISRLFNEEPRKLAASPSKSSSNDSTLKENGPPGRARSAVTGETTSSIRPLADAPTQIATQTPSITTAKQGSELNTTGANSEARPEIASVAAASAKAGAKRKFAVNDDNSRAPSKATTVNAGNAATTTTIETGQTPVRELKNPRSIRELVNSRNKDTKEGGKEANKAVPSGGRKPLAAKSTNQDVSSPRKRMQENNGGKPAKGQHGQPPAKQAAAGGGRLRDRTRQQQPPVVVSVADVTAPPAVDEIIVDTSKDEVDATQSPCPESEPPQPANPSTEGPSLVVCPSTPPPASSLVSQRLAPTHGEGGRDTPPPADISSQGETTRPSRRARTSVSYVEPNLRDKMRRPTKELFDAVAGEGKYVQRQQLHNQSHSDGSKLPHSVSEENVAAHEKEHQLPPSASKPTDADPTAEKRRQRASSVGAGAGGAALKNQQASASGTAKEPPAATDGKDPYDILTSLSDANTSPEEAGAAELGGGGRKGVSGGGRASSKASRRASAAASSASSLEGDSNANVVDRHMRPSAARKRASMAALKRSSMLESDEEEEDAADSSYEPPAVEHSTRERVSRRRSMML